MFEHLLSNLTTDSTGQGPSWMGSSQTQTGLHYPHSIHSNSYPWCLSIQPQGCLSLSSKVIHPSISLSQLRCCAKLIIPNPPCMDTPMSCEALPLMSLIVGFTFQPACGREDTRVNLGRQWGRRMGR